MKYFCYWIQGFFEIAKPETMTVEHVAMVQKHLPLEFIHEICPSAGPPEHHAKLNEMPKRGVHGQAIADPLKWLPAVNISVLTP